MLAARRRERLEKLASELADAEPVCVRPLASPTHPAPLVDATLGRFGRVDVLVNNAGKDAMFPAMEEPVDSFRDVLEVNLVAPFALAQLSARSMVESGTGGTIVNVASLWGLVGVGQIPMASYAASKGGLVNLTRASWRRSGPGRGCA